MSDFLMASTRSLISGVKGGFKLGKVEAVAVVAVTVEGACAGARASSLASYPSPTPIAAAATRPAVYLTIERRDILSFDSIFFSSDNSFYFILVRCVA